VPCAPKLEQQERKGPRLTNRDSSVVIATGYGLDGRSVQNDTGAYQASLSMVIGGNFFGVKAAGA
jgi:hypothetical protein